MRISRSSGKEREGKKTEGKERKEKKRKEKERKGKKRKEKERKGKKRKGKEKKGTMWKEFILLYHNAQYPYSRTIVELASLIRCCSLQLDELASLYTL